jgi:cytochrome P450
MTADTFSELARLRSESAVCEAGRGVHLVLRHAEAMAVLRNHRAFSGCLTPDDDSQRVLHEMEIPDHPRVRALLLFTGLARDVVEQRGQAVRDLWDQLARTLEGQGRVDLVADYTRPGVRASFAEIIGIPEGERDMVYGWIAELRADVGTSLPEFRGRASRVSAEALREYVLAEANARRRAPGPPDDLFTRLVFVQDTNGNTLSDDELVMLMRLLCQAGIGSTSRSLGNLLYELIRVPERWADVRDDRALVEPAVEESLRHDPPGLTVERRCVHATQLDDARIEPEDIVVVNLGSANRDEAIYSEPEGFDYRRERLSEHLSFGRGRHRCVGAPLARLILRSALTALLDSIECPRLDPGFTYKPETFGAWGPRTLDVVLA